MPSKKQKGNVVDDKNIKSEVIAGTEHEVKLPVPDTESGAPDDLPPFMKIETNATVEPHKPTISEKIASAAKVSKTAAKVLSPTKTPPKVKRARLRVTRLDPLSVLRTSFLFAMAAAIILFTVVVVVWTVLSVSGALESIQKILDSVVGSGSGGAMQLSRYLETWRVLGFTALISVINVVLLTLLGTVTAYLYNLAASIYGGIEITLAEDPH
ncbi:MAG: DUF3566 domain-containing protein [Propionibacteriaceae bacterium]|nr:DUF3566 domain-containing protein [Propionibacteriaceae bacterium]